jgi:hypothetical protein
MMKRGLVGLLLLLCLAAPAWPATISITGCGQAVTRGQRGVLAADLDCGHQWGTCFACATGGPACGQLQPAVPCSSPAECPDPVVDKCDGVEPVPSVGVFVAPGARLDLGGHSIHAAQFGVWGGAPDFTSSSKAQVRVSGPGSISGTREGVSAFNATLTGVALHDNLYGVSGSRLNLIETDASSNTIGVNAFESARATRLTADGNRYLGLLSYRKARISTSYLTGSGAADVVSEDRPRVSHSTCGRSAALEETAQPGLYEPSGPPWGVCSAD